MRLLLPLMVLAIGMRPSRETSAVGGDCLYDCEGSVCADYGNHSSMCGELRAKCQARCSGRRWWGAIAYSAPDKGYGWSVDWNTVEGAKKQAMDRCAVKGSACKLWIWFENECGALAVSGDKVTWGTAFLESAAKQRAISECQKAGGRNCSIEVWACSKM